MGLTKILLALYLTGLTLTHVIVSVAGDERQDFLDGHNKARAEVGHGVKPLVWNHTLAAYAQAYANKRIPDCKLEKSDPNGPYGECLAEGHGEFKATDVVNGWVSEKKYYEHQDNKCVGGECGYYTQVIWRDTKYLGCGKSKCHNGRVFVTCNYYPSGNYYGERPY